MKYDIRATMRAGRLSCWVDYVLTVQVVSPCLEKKMHSCVCLESQHSCTCLLLVDVFTKKKDVRDGFSRFQVSGARSSHQEDVNCENGACVDPCSCDHAM